MESVRVCIETRQGRLERQVEIPAGPMRLAELARLALELSGEFSGVLERAAQAGGAPVTCRKGCGVCCRQLVTISPAEAWLIGELLEATPEPRRGELRGRFAAIEKRLRETGLLERLMHLSDPALSEEAHYEIAEEYFRLGLACPFLEEEACGIYPARPSVCREYLVTSPPVRCANPFAEAIERLPNSAEIGEALAGLCAQLLKTELEKIPLCLAPSWARAHEAGMTRTWDGRSLLSRFLLHLEVAICS